MAFDVTGYEQTLAANGSTTEYGVVGACHVSLSGDFGGGTAVIERKNAADEWVAVATASYTEAVDKVLNFPPNSHNKVRVTLSGSTSPDLDVIIQGSSRFMAA